MEKSVLAQNMEGPTSDGWAEILSHKMRISIFIIKTEKRNVLKNVSGHQRLCEALAADRISISRWNNDFINPNQ